ncbi:unnamed protein product [Musa hybrid cultivar]
MPMMALLASPHPPTIFRALSCKRNHLRPRITSPPPSLLLLTARNLSLVLARSADGSADAVDGNMEKKDEAVSPTPRPLESEKNKQPHQQQQQYHHHEIRDGSVVKAQALKFEDTRWVGGTWDTRQFGKNGRTDWDAVIHAEASRRKWLEDHPEASSIDEPVIFDTSIIPWWAWIKSFHLPEAEKLNGRAAMIGFFMAYFIDSLTGIGLVGQTGNFFCKTMLFATVVWVLLIRENRDIKNLNKLFEETTMYDKQWRATWQDDAPGDSKK